MKVQDCPRCGRRCMELRRGVCQRCYDHFRYLVRQGKATWKGLIFGGFLIPSGKGKCRDFREGLPT